MKLGVITDCFKKTHEEGIKKAAELKLDGVQIYATTGEFSPELSKEQKERYKTLIKESGLVISALCGDMGGYGFEIEKDNAERIEYLFSRPHNENSETNENYRQMASIYLKEKSGKITVLSYRFVICIIPTRTSLLF